MQQVPLCDWSVLSPFHCSPGRVLVLARRTHVGSLHHRSTARAARQCGCAAVRLRGSPHPRCDLSCFFSGPHRCSAQRSGIAFFFLFIAKLRTDEAKTKVVARRRFDQFAGCCRWLGRPHGSGPESHFSFAVWRVCAHPPNDSKGIQNRDTYDAERESLINPDKVFSKPRGRSPHRLHVVSARGENAPSPRHKTAIKKAS